ncbi:MAG: hypothetical protein RLZZ230_719 [Candidatus Parcubacteria bacterium]|jgi:competence protein ComEC
MSGTLSQLRIIIIFILAGTALTIWLPQSLAITETQDFLSVQFLDVGQGDSIHITTPDGYEMLIDGGPSSAVLRELAKGRSFFDKNIDVVIATHPDSDHVAGLVDVLERYQVDYLLETNVKSDSQAAVAYEAVARTEGARIIVAEAGQTIQLGASTTVYILSPQGDTTDWETNTASIVVQVVYGNTSFMLTGDAPSSIEDYLVGQYGSALHSDVLKLGHHGSNSASDELFLDAVTPQYAVVSAGKDNRYGHPRQEVLDRVQERGIEVVSTIEKGTIELESDGTRVWVK